MPSFTVKSWWTDQTQQGGGTEVTHHPPTKVAGYRATTRTAILYGEPPDIMDGEGNVAWRLTDENRGSYERALRTAVKSKLGFTANDVIPVGDLGDIQGALESGGYSRAVYVGHASNFGDGEGTIMPDMSKPWIGGDKLGAALPSSVKDFYFLGCDPSGVAAQAAAAAPGINFNPGGSSLLRQVVDWDPSRLSQPVKRINFVPYE